MEYLILAICGFVGLIFVAHLPILPIIRVLQLPVPDKTKIIKCFIEAWLKNCFTIIPDLIAPIVIPIALLFTKREDNKLPQLFKWWDNDVSINGDGWAVYRDGKWVKVHLDELPGEVPIFYADPKYTGDSYYAPGHHPRSFYARWVWLGLRNRASKLSQMLGYTDPLNAPMGQYKGDTWYINKIEDKYRYYEEIPLGNFYIRLHYGYKIPRYEDRERQNVVAIGFSIRKKK